MKVIEFYYMKTCPKCKFLLDMLTEIVALFPNDLILRIQEASNLQDVYSSTQPAGQYFSRSHLYPEIVIDDTCYIIPTIDKTVLTKIFNLLDNLITKILEKPIYAEVKTQYLLIYQNIKHKYFSYFEQ